MALMFTVFSCKYHIPPHLLYKGPAGKLGFRQWLSWHQPLSPPTPFRFVALWGGNHQAIPASGREHTKEVPPVLGPRTLWEEAVVDSESEHLPPLQGTIAGSLPQQLGGSAGQRPAWASLPCDPCLLELCPPA